MMVSCPWESAVGRSDSSMLYLYNTIVLQTKDDDFWLSVDPKGVVMALFMFLQW